jgi:hypothetical protein
MAKIGWRHYKRSKGSPKHCDIPLSRIAAADDNVPMHASNRKYPFWTNVHKGYREKAFYTPDSTEAF